MNDAKITQDAPEPLGDAGTALWRSITDAYELQPHEGLQLVQACHVADRLRMLAEAIEDKLSGPVVTEWRQTQILLARLLANLRVPTGDQTDDEATSTSPVPRLRPKRQGHRGVRQVTP